MSCECECGLTVSSVSSDKHVAYIDQNITFTADVSGSCSCVDWSGGGDPATASGSCSFTTKWDSTGTKTVRATPDCGSSKSKEVEIISDLTVIPREASVCVGCTKDFQAWVCVGGTATDVTSSATFSASKGGFVGNRFNAGSTPSASIGADYVRAVYGETSTEDTGGDCELTVVGIEITENPGSLLVYTGSEAGNQPTKTATAVGAPSGGAYSWTRFRFGNGDIEFVSGQTSSIVTIRGTAPSSEPLKDDVELIVTYFGCEDSVALRVRRMSSTTSHAGKLIQTAGMSTRCYYHRVKDQFDAIIDKTGIPCDETVTLLEGEEQSWTADDQTRSHSSDGAWPGGIAVKDTLGCPNNAENTKYDQQIDAGGWGTSPDYFIWFQIGEEEQIWKTTQ